MRLDLFGLAAATCVALSGQVLFADETVPIVGGSNNLLYGQYSAVANHPDCARPDEVAFTVPLHGENLEYVLFDPTNTRGVSSRGEEVGTNDACYITNRRGAEVTRTRIPCAQEPVNDLEGWIEELDVSIALDGTATFCMSPMRVALIDTDLSVTVAHAGEEAEFAVYNMTAPDGLHMRFQYRTDAFQFPFLSPADRDHPLIGSLRGVDTVLVETRCVPVERPAANGDPLYVGFRAIFAVVNDARQTCSEAECPALGGYEPIRLSGTGNYCS